MEAIALSPHIDFTRCLMVTPGRNLRNMRSSSIPAGLSLATFNQTNDSARRTYAVRPQHTQQEQAMEPQIMRRHPRKASPGRNDLKAHARTRRRKLAAGSWQVCSLSGEVYDPPNVYKTPDHHPPQLSPPRTSASSRGSPLRGYISGPEALR